MRLQLQHSSCVVFPLLHSPSQCKSRSQACSRGAPRWDRAPMQEEAGRRLVSSGFRSRDTAGRREKRTRQPPPIVGFVIFSGPRASFSSRSTVTPAGRTELKRTSQLRPSHRRRAGFPFRASWRPQKDPRPAHLPCISDPIRSPCASHIMDFG